jgi:hypothetical protein
MLGMFCAESIYQYNKLYVLILLRRINIISYRWFGCTGRNQWNNHNKFLPVVQYSRYIQPSRVAVDDAVVLSRINLKNMTSYLYC